MLPEERWRAILAMANLDPPLPEEKDSADEAVARSHKPGDAEIGKEQQRCQDEESLDCGDDSMKRFIEGAELGK